MPHSIPDPSALKTCTKCGQSKPLSAFHNLRGALRPTCKVCTNAQNRDIYARHKGAHLAAKRRYRAEHADARAATLRKYETTHAQKRAAHAAVHTELRAGRMAEPNTLPCACCSAPAEIYHHESYTRENWLNVTPLCRRCHGEVHRRGV